MGVCWCISSGKGRRHCDQVNSSLWRRDVVEQGGCDWGGGCEDAGEDRGSEPCCLDTWCSEDFEYLH